MTSSAGINPVVRVPLAGLLAWVIPGLGHIFIGQRARGLICLVTVSVTFWGGVAIGGVRDTIDPHKRTAWFMAQTCTGAQAVLAYGWAQRLRNDPAAPAHALWMSADTGVVYSGVAGLLNILVILDALARADVGPGGRSRVPVRQRRGVP